MHQTINTEYRQIDVSWDEKLLKRRAAPQTVRILNEEFNEYMRQYNKTIPMNIENSDWLYDRIPENLEGKLDYKDLTWDYMKAAFVRFGMIAAVSEKVKNILEELNVLKDEYVLKPIKIKNFDLTYYLMFVKYLSKENILLRDCDIRFSENPAINVPVESFDEVDEYNRNYETRVYYKTVAIPQKFQTKDIICVEGATIYPCFSKRILDAFEQNKVKGYRIFSRTKLKFI